jgi:hypothetical protein
MAIASRLAPTGDLQWPLIFGTTEIHCGSGLAREGVSPVNINIEHDTYHSDSQP